MPIHKFGPNVSDESRSSLFGKRERSASPQYLHQKTWEVQRCSIDSPSKFACLLKLKRKGAALTRQTHTKAKMRHGGIHGGETLSGRFDQKEEKAERRFNERAS